MDAKQANGGIRPNSSNLEKDSAILYAGGDRPSWVDYIPTKWRPYIQLSRLNFAAPVLLVYLPHFYGVMHTAIVHRHDYRIQDVVYVCILLLGGSFFYSNAAHAWDDIVDVPLDRKMERTKNRPIARGAITTKAAFVFTVAQALMAASFLLLLPPAAAMSAVPSVLTATYYPYAKRHTYLPQVVLGFCLAWGVVTGSASLGLKQPWDSRPRMCLVLACTIWTVIYDTIYAHIDVPEDLRLGLKSTAVLFRHHLKSFLWSLLGCMAVLLHCCGVLSDLGLLYFIIAEGSSIVYIGLMIYRVELNSETSCYRWFSMGFWVPGFAIAFGLIGEYLLG
ncbi:UbiA prenyltransferase family-domain-containing protein [Hypoxylon trugodes]|uniref:UbiA prenyltransferase family-domain-containing protein n=1 Tax=Hypoxylon trugodes TaxID=326681 RepID=UPI00218F023C|nr:UbiA prenyltransferase family-domain-containing protein [Hypoxylon trugodes]KAI1391741.1 UbiA prenyltransferase family-domain-containing protein [Hypoxylon trugodes]